MSLKDTIFKWHRAICLLEQNQWREAIQSLKEIENPSAKIVYNIGCILMHKELYQDALEYFTCSIDKDKYLAISYFQRGVCHHHMGSNSSAEKDFASARSMILDEAIDYRQLGADIILRVEMTMPPSIQIPFMESIFHPPKKMVANLKKEDFLGKAKVISSVQETDIIYAENKAKVLQTKGMPSTLPSIPSRLSKAQLASRQSSTTGTLCPARPPPRMDKNKSRSLDNLLLGDNETNQSFPSGARAARLQVRDDFSKNRRSHDDGLDDRTDSSHQRGNKLHWKGLSTSSSALDKPDVIKPPVPRRPVPPVRKEVTTRVNLPRPPQPTQGNDFRNLQEALKKKLAVFEQSEDKTQRYKYNTSLNEGMQNFKSHERERGLRTSPPKSETTQKPRKPPPPRPSNPPSSPKLPARPLPRTARP